MIAQPLHVIGGFLPHVVQKPLITGVEAAAKHEILPKKNSHLIAKFVEIVTLINTATPHPQHVHVAVARRFQQLPVFGFTDAGRKAIGWNPVGSFGEHGNTIDYEGETFA